jgi:hypothetical protein
VASSIEIFSDALSESEQAEIFPDDNGLTSQQ